MSLNILGTGFYVPENVITNDDLAERVDTSDEWITQRVGVKHRHLATDESTADMAVRAAQNALSNARITADRLDLILVATITADTICPTTAGTVQQALRATCPAFDLNSACSGFLFALDTAAAFISRGGIGHALVIGADRLSKIVDWTDRSTCVIFGDGAGAAVVGPGENYLSSLLYTKGGNDVLDIPSFAGVSPFFTGQGRSPLIHMQGQETFKFAVSKMEEDIRAVTQKAGYTLEDIDHVVTHQANIRIIDYAAKRLGIPREKFFVNIQEYGNTSAASLPIALSELADSGNLHRGDLVVFSAFGGGLSSAACLIRW